MANKYKFKARGTGRRAEVTISGTITLSGSGVIASQSSELATALKTSATTGRYSLTFDKKYKGLPRCVGLSIALPSGSAFGNTTANAVNYRNPATGSVDLQLILASSGADTDGPTGLIISYEFAVQEF